MAASAFKTTQYTASALTESCGALLFDTKAQMICLLWHKQKREWLLPKGRRNIGESRAEAAVRETREETGFQCRLLPVAMGSRQPLAEDAVNAQDQAKVVRRVVEPFMVTTRQVTEGRVKMIWWFVGVTDEGPGGREEGDVLHSPVGEKEFEVGWFAYEAAAEQATYESDREILRKGIGVLRRTVG